MNKEDLLEIWKRFAEKNDFIVNPDEKHVGLVADGVLKNEETFGLKLCPCRLRDGTKEKDLELSCPCNFKTHETWQSQGRCWCGLYVKE